MKNVISLILLVGLFFSCSNYRKIENIVYHSEHKAASIYYRIITVDPNVPYIFFLHGGPGGNTIESEHLFPLITDNEFNWVFMDQRGSGRSSVYHKNPQKSDLLKHQISPELMIEDIEYIRSKHKLGRIIIYGHSWGGNLAARYVEEYSDFVSGYIIASTAHHFEENTLALRDTYLNKILSYKEILNDIKANGITDNHQMYKNELKRLFDAQGQSDLFYELYLNKIDASKIDNILSKLMEVEINLLETKEKKFSGKILHDILNNVLEIGAYGLPAIPSVELDQLPEFSPIKQNTVRELFGDTLIKDNEFFYPNIKVKGMFWCGFNDVWDESVMIKASQLAANSSYFVFPGSGHHYYLSEPNLFKIKLKEAVDMFTGRTFIMDEKDIYKFTGKYSHLAFGECNITIENKKLVCYLKKNRILLTPIALNQFRMSGGPASGAKINFRFSKSGEIKAFIAKGITFRRD